MRIVIAGGGTGGHLFPGMALAEELRKRGHELLFVGTSRGIESRVLPEAGWPLELIDVGGIKGLGFGGLARGLLKIPRSLLQSLRILRRARAEMAIGVGGYASGPLVLAAALTGRPTAILEQNSVPGITNRILSRLVGRVFTSFDHSHSYFPRRKVRPLGNPIRASIRDRADSSPYAATQQRPPLVLVCGGSQGAHAINTLVPEAIELLRRFGHPLPTLIHQTGKSDREQVAERYRAAGIEADVREFISDMAGAFADADLVVGRAGATTLAEITAFGRASILVPFPHATDDHQRINAAALEEAGAALVFAESGLSAETLGAAIGDLCGDAERRRRMAAASRRLGRPDAAAKISDELLTMVPRRPA